VRIKVPGRWEQPYVYAYIFPTKIRIKINKIKLNTIQMYELISP
jgi:hypothetical protein